MLDHCTTKNPWVSALAGANYWIVIAISAGLAASCQKQSDKKISITGSSTIAPLASEIAKHFEAANPGWRVDVQTGGSSRGISDVRKGIAEIGMVSRALSPLEKDLKATTVAFDGIAFIVNSKNPVKRLTDREVREIYTGKVLNWKQVGGKDAKIVVINKAEGRSTLGVFLDYFRLTNQQIRASIVIGDNQQGIMSVAADPQAIAYVSIGAASQEIRRGSTIRLLPLAGINANIQNVKTGQYPLSRPLNLVTTLPVKPSIERFMTFASSPQVQDLVENQFFVTPKR